MLKQFKETILFLVKFAIFYVALTATYDYYLSSFKSESFHQSDSMTVEVAAESAHLAEYLGGTSDIMQNDFEPSVRFVLNDMERIKIIEGCNGVSVMIIFVTFVLAFGGRLIYTILFIPTGVLIIHIFNVFRITALAYLYNYDLDIAKIAHDYVFQPFIYGVVFLLWIVWVNYFSDLSSEKA